ncbi:unnamed protein product [Symbiodinium sp. CCMP2592]|nr:unnamed protein product [Symbiodinium sp. CCMP2592]
MQLACGSSAANPTKYILLGQEVGRKCLSKLLGVGSHRLQKVESAIPDLRHGKRAYRSHLESYSVDAFLQNAYDAIAETLPHQYVRRGRARPRRPGRSDDTEDELSDADQEIASDIENTEELAEWIDKPDAPILAASSRKIRKYLPPGNLAELFQHYRAAQTLLGRPGVGYKTFCHIYSARWKPILAFRDKSFTQCAVCYAYQQTLKDKTADMSTKLAAVSGLRSHLHDQYCDRAVAWQLQESAMDPLSGLMVVCTDGCDQSKFMMPRDPEFRISAALSGEMRPRLKVHGLWVFGLSLQVYVMDEPTKHDSACVVECLALSLERDPRLQVRCILSLGCSNPVVADNTVREAKNQYVLLYLAALVAQYRMRFSCLANFRKSHTHCRIDQLWGCLARRIANESKLLNPDDVCHVLLSELQKASMRAWLGPNTEVLVERLVCVRDWRNHLPTIGVGLEGGLLKDSSSNHMFFFMLRRGLDAALSISTLHVPADCSCCLESSLCVCAWTDLPSALMTSVTEGSFRGPRDPLDVVVLLKKHICDPMLSQSPLLVLPRTKADGWESLPSTKRVNNHSAKNQKEWQELAQKVLSHYNEPYRRAVDYLEKLARNQFWHEAVLRDMPWHIRPPAPPVRAQAGRFLHEAVEAALAPALPLKAIFSRR